MFQDLLSNNVFMKFFNILLTKEYIKKPYSTMENS